MRWSSSIKNELEETTSRPYFDTGEDPPGGKKKKAQSVDFGTGSLALSGGIGQSDGGEQNIYQLADDFGQLMNAGGVVWGVAEMGIQAMRQNNGAQTIGKALGFGTQQTAQALRSTLGVVSKVGKGLGVVGYGLQVGTSVYKAANNIPISTC
ncbi:MAG: hypothetical protein KatS3mg028_0616 [Bacteroidia bacterium]|nr:MAG: hypothetical protein KatS3mg028_0616 [Bacteroidia bacterium]